MVEVALLAGETVRLEEDKRGVVFKAAGRGRVGEVGGDTEGLAPDARVVVGGV